jgi:hypothetical protein
MGKWSLLDEFLARPEARFESIVDAGATAARGVCSAMCVCACVRV